MALPVSLLPSVTSTCSGGDNWSTLLFPPQLRQRLVLSARDWLQAPLLAAMSHYAFHDLIPRPVMCCRDCFDMTHASTWLTHCTRWMCATVSTCLFPAFAHLAHTSSGLLRVLCSRVAHGNMRAMVCNSRLLLLQGTAAFASHLTSPLYLALASAESPLPTLMLLARFHCVSPFLHHIHHTTSLAV